MIPFKKICKAYVFWFVLAFLTMAGVNTPWRETAGNGSPAPWGEGISRTTQCLEPLVSLLVRVPLGKFGGKAVADRMVHAGGFPQLQTPPEIGLNKIIPGK
jgi:hypothetical protein